MTKPTASLSLDLDNKWAYMKTHGDPGWQTYPSYLGIVVPRVLRFLAERSLKITFFVVGRDAAISANSEFLRSIADAGHEIGNHSFDHEPWLHLYSREQLINEIARAEEQIEQVTGQRPIGFRGPGYSTSDEVIRVLTSRGYLYDASILPTFIGPLARTYYFFSTSFDAVEKDRRKALFGKWSDGLLPLAPYPIACESGRLIEIPVTTMPIFRMPIHISYVLYISGFSRVLARNYFRLALRLCHLTHIQPSLLLHPLDFLGCDDIDQLRFFPGMAARSGDKMDVVSELLEMFCHDFSVTMMREHAAAVDPVLAREPRGESANVA